MRLSHLQGLLKVIVFLIAPKDWNPQVLLFVPCELNPFRPHLTEENSFD